MRAPRTPQRQSGSGAVEMALLLPVVLLVFFAIIDFSRFFFLRASLTAAVSDAARLASLPAAADADIKALITASLADPVSQGGDAASVTVTITPEARQAGEPVTVAADLPYRPMLLPGLMGVSIFPDTITASATTVVEP